MSESSSGASSTKGFGRHLKPRKWTGSKGGFGISRMPLSVLAAWWLWMPLVYFVIQGFINWRTPGVGTWHQFWHLLWQDITALDAGVLGMSPWFWLWLCIGLVGSALILAFIDDDGMSYGEMILVVVSVLAACFTIYPISAGFHDSDKDEAYFYLSNTTVHVEDTQNPPSSLRLLFSQRDAPQRQDGDILYIGEPAKVKQGVLPTNEWRKRNSSFDGAKKSLNQKTSVSQGVNVYNEAVTYVYGSSESEDRWSAPLDGSKYENPMIGVAEWRGGENVPHICRFDTNPNGTYRFTRAFHGEHLNSLTNVLALEYPDLSYEEEDIAGYCDSADKPVIVIAVTRRIGWRASTEQVPAGVLVVRGSTSGYPAIEYRPVVEAGEFPVPVYPLSIARTQRQNLDWLAGRGNLVNADFGYEPSSFSSQAGNNGEYVLMSKADNSMVAYTPLTAQSSTSQLYVAHTRIRVDSVRNGTLNPLDAYVLPDKFTDGRKLVDPQSLDSLAQRLVQNTPTFQNFINSGGKLKEYAPTGPHTFRGYGEDSNGATVLYIDLDSSNEGAKATVVTLDPETGKELGSAEVSLDSPAPQAGGGSTPQAGGSATVTCNGKSVKVATVQEVEACLRAYQDELVRRLKEQQATPAATSTPTTSPTPAATKQQ